MKWKHWPRLVNSVKRPMLTKHRSFETVKPGQQSNCLIVNGRLPFFFFFASFRSEFNFFRIIWFFRNASSRWRSFRRMLTRRRHENYAITSSGSEQWTMRVGRLKSMVYLLVLAGSDDEEFPGICTHQTVRYPRTRGHTQTHSQARGHTHEYQPDIELSRRCPRIECDRD